jgi:hypothetical protein
MSDVAQLLLVLVGMLVVAAAAAVSLTVYVVRRLGRGLRRSLTRLAGSLASGAWTARRGGPSPESTIADRAATCLLRARCWLPTRTRRIDVLRLQLRHDLDTACSAVHAGLRVGRPVEQLQPICRDLRHAATQLDLDLLVTAAEPDAAHREAMLDGQAERRGTFTQACAQLRRAVLLAGDPTADPLLARAVNDLHDEMDLLRLRAEAYRELSTGATSRSRRTWAARPSTL